MAFKAWYFVNGDGGLAIRDLEHFFNLATTDEVWRLPIQEFCLNPFVHSI